MQCGGALSSLAPAGMHGIPTAFPPWLFFQNSPPSGWDCTTLKVEGFGLDREEEEEFQVGENIIKGGKHREGNLGTGREVTEGSCRG